MIIFLCLSVLNLTASSLWLEGSHRDVSLFVAGMCFSIFTDKLIEKVKALS